MKGDLHTEFGHKSGVFSVQCGAPAESARSTLLYLHGFPGSALEASILHHAAREARVRIIAIDRPGFGKSITAPAKLYSVSAVAQVAAQVMQELAIPKYSVVATSGGCPYALGLASVAPQAVEGLVIVSGLGELTVAHALSGMIAQNRLILSIAKRAPLVCLPAVRVIAEQWRSRPHKMIRLMGKMLTGEDRSILQDAAFGDLYADSMQRGVAAGYRGPYEELKRITRPWGLEFNAIKCPIQIFHGDADRYVPLSHAQWLNSKVPHARVTVCAGHGHFMAVRMGSEILHAVRLMKRS